ncbi:uncharacterized protein CC84DRAFT_1191782 [Paraphaeosphaeria sporulosa]|uniref:Uncharacterized protein n=1 Tax=Paraphaeosphaeria sporulosa TaxID=1460663 RepID=A0A177BVI0_9PLEO|nr:uncharacterized protein CC84DRAFT_1191782 [Paraphaeosphaeria sporulosa]OAF98547.1 hypothetical protein CC84DRAFT_1191782 [Paraphaeosphaeria sporulosa]
MSYNKVISSKVIKTVNAGGKAIQGVQDEFCEALKKAGDVPAGAAIAILDEKEYPSEIDSKSHFTTVFEDSKGNHITTKHVYP